MAACEATLTPLLSPGVQEVRRSVPVITKKGKPFFLLLGLESSGVAGGSPKVRFEFQVMYNNNTLSIYLIIIIIAEEKCVKFISVQ